VALEPGGADARDAGRDVEDGVGHLRGDEVRLVARGHREEHVGVGRARLGQDLGLGGVATTVRRSNWFCRSFRRSALVSTTVTSFFSETRLSATLAADLAGASDEDLQVGGGIVG